MSKTQAILAVIVSCFPVGRAQNARRPAFEVATIRVYPEGSSFPEGGGNSIHTTPAGIAARYIKFAACLQWAYDIPGRIIGLSWINSEGLDVTAKAEGPVSEKPSSSWLRVYSRSGLN